MDDLFEEMYLGSREAILFGIADLRMTLNNLEREIRSDGDIRPAIAAIRSARRSMENVLEEVTVYEKCAKVLDMRLDVAKQQLKGF
jgi:hypothetical protein